MNQPPPEILTNNQNFPGCNSFVYLETAPKGKDLVRYDKFVQLLFKQESEKDMAMHMALGICGEAGELADAIKRQYVYNKAVDHNNIIEELGDLRFYIQAVMNHYGISEQEVLQLNAAKLSLRYKSLTYSDSAAQERADKKA
jgi:NTP pyrophosphatase (non-canonical NTP hydrolase)